MSVVHKENRWCDREKMKFYYDKKDGTSKELTMEEVREHMSEYQIKEGIEAKQEDPCEAKVKKFEQFVDKLQAAQKNKANGAAALKEFAALVKEADAEQAAVKECINNVDYKSRVQNAMMRCKTSLK